MGWDTRKDWPTLDLLVSVASHWKKTDFHLFTLAYQIYLVALENRSVRNPEQWAWTYWCWREFKVFGIHALNTIPLKTYENNIVANSQLLGSAERFMSTKVLIVVPVQDCGCDLIIKTSGPLLLQLCAEMLHMNGPVCTLVHRVQPADACLFLLSRALLLMFLNVFPLNQSQSAVSHKPAFALPLHVLTVSSLWHAEPGHTSTRPPLLIFYFLYNNTVVDFGSPCCLGWPLRLLIYWVFPPPHRAFLH